MSDAPRRGRGRPRRAESDADILGAARALLVERSYGAISMDDIAREAGVAKTTVYRRWPSKAALVADIVRGEDDLLGGELRRVVASLIGEAQESGETREIVRELLAELRREAGFAETLAKLMLD